MVAPAYVQPDKYVVMSIIKPETGVRTKFVLAGFYGGYLHGDSWRLSRDVVEESEDEDSWTLKTRTGSVYRLVKGHGGTTGMTAPILADMERQKVDAPELEWRLEEDYK